MKTNHDAPQIISVLINLLLKKETKQLASL